MVTLVGLTVTPPRNIALRSLIIRIHRKYLEIYFEASCKYIDEFKVAWRKIKRRVWRLPAQAHNTIVRDLTCDVDHQLDNRMLKFIHMCLNHHNKVCRSLLLSKVNCKNSTFTSNYHYLSCKYDLSHSDWYIDTIATYLAKFK